jgi:hypothetical protein
VLAGVSFGFTTGWRLDPRARSPDFAQFLAIGLAMTVSIAVATHPN